VAVVQFSEHSATGPNDALELAPYQRLPTVASGQVVTDGFGSAPSPGQPNSRLLRPRYRVAGWSEVSTVRLGR
jgi:hypothetical protein